MLVQAGRTQGSSAPQPPNRNGQQLLPAAAGQLPLQLPRQPSPAPSSRPNSTTPGEPPIFVTLISIDCDSCPSRVATNSGYAQSELPR